MCLSACLSACLSVCFFVYPAICLSVYLSIRIYLSICLFDPTICIYCLFALSIRIYCLTVSRPICVCVRICLSTYLIICLSFDLSIYLSTYLSIYLSIYPSINQVQWHNQAPSIPIVSSPIKQHLPAMPARRGHHPGVWRIAGSGQDWGGWFDGAVESRLSWPRGSARRSFCRGQDDPLNGMKWEWDHGIAMDNQACGHRKTLSHWSCQTVILDTVKHCRIGLLKEVLSLLPTEKRWNATDWAHRHPVNASPRVVEPEGPSVPIEAHGWWSFGCVTWNWNPWSKSTLRGAAFCFSGWRSMKLVFGSKQSLSLCQCTGCRTWRTSLAPPTSGDSWSRGDFWGRRSSKVTKSGCD